MDLFRNLTSHVTSGIIRLGVAVAVLFLGYLFLLKPVMDRSSDVIDKTGQSEIVRTLDEVHREVSRQVEKALTGTRSEERHRKLAACVERAGEKTMRLHRCTQRFGP